MRMAITLWGRLTSVNVQKVVWALEELGLAYENVPRGGTFGGLDEPAYRALNPNGRVPTLRDGDVVVWESHAIVRYLAASYGAGSLWPLEPRERAESDKWTDWTATTFQPGWLAVFEGIVRTPEAERDPAHIARAEAAAHRLYAMLDQRLADRDFLGGTRPTYADIVAGASMFRWMTMPHERPALPNLEAWHRRLMARPAFVKAVCVDFSDMYGTPLPAGPN
jgi:glutathione S-transferase